MTSVASCFDAWVAFSNSPELDASARAPHTKYRKWGRGIAGDGCRGVGVLDWDQMPKLAKCHLGVIGWQSRKSLLSSSRDPRDPKIGVSPDPSLLTTK